MQLKGLCNICGKPAEIYTCSLCGNMVCRECYDLNRRICKKCKINPGKTI